MNKAEREIERAAILAAYNQRILAKDRDLRSGFSALHLYMLLFGLTAMIGFLLPAAILQIVSGYSEPGMARGLLILPISLAYFTWFLARFVVPIGYVLIWQFDMFSDKIAYVRPSDVKRLFMLAFWRCRDDLTLRQFRRNHA